MPKMTDTVKQEAEGFHGEFNASLKAIRQNQDLTPAGRQRQIAAGYLRAKQGLDAVRQEFMAGAEQTAKVHSRDIFGAASTLGADAISVRDAADRASRLADADEALRLMQMAEENGDEVLARAVAQQAYRQAQQAILGDEGWGSVLGEYLGARPEVAAKLTEMEAAQASDLETNFRNEGVFFLGPPSEIASFSETAVAGLATQEVSA